MFIYLTNNVKGDTTLSPKDDAFTSKCRAGNMLIFPPYWPWIHAGEQPANTTKYILGSYLHYAE
jgi:hypothetical protein